MEPTLGHEPLVPSTISVVIPVRNGAALLAETLASVMAQTRLPKTVVVVDDGSDDDSVAVAAARFPQATLIRQQHLGTAAARNRGAAATDADAVLFLDADDLLRPEALASLGAALDADRQVDLVHGRMREFVDQRNPPPPGMRHTDWEVAARVAGSTLIRSTFWDRTGGMDEGLARGEWIDWMSRALGLGPRVSEVDDVVLDRRLHASNKSASAGDDRTPYLAAVVRAAILRKRRAEAEPGPGD